MQKFFNWEKTQKFAIWRIGKIINSENFEKISNFEN